MKTKKFALIITTVLAALLIVSSVTLTLALWSDASGGETGIAPAVTVYDWNYWTKYFRYDAYDASSNLIASGVAPSQTLSSAVDHFVAVSFVGTTQSDIVFPKSVSYNFDGAKTAYVTSISSTVFASNTLKQLPISIAISPSITSISAAAFQNLSNLSTVTFAGVDTSVDLTLSATSAITLGVGAFAGCSVLKSIQLEGTRKINFSESSFGGCTALTTLTKSDCTLAYLQSNGTLTTLTSSNFATYRSAVFAGCTLLSSPF